METILKIEGMSCDHCIMHVTNGILDVEGVKSIEVILEEGKAFVQHDEKVTFEMLKIAVEDVGYGVI